MPKSIKEMIAESQGSTSFFNADSTPGDMVEGPIIGTAVRQATDFKTKEKLFWDDGNPREQIVVTLSTDLRNPKIEDDDGTRSVYIKWWGGQRQALVEAIKASGDDDIQVGGWFRAVYVRQDEPEQRGLSGTKVYQYTYRPPSPTAGLVGQTAAVPQQATAVQQPATPPAPPAAPPTDPWAAAAAAAAAAAPPPPPVDPQALIAQVKQHIAAGETDAQIAQGMGAPIEAIAAIRNMP